MRFFALGWVRVAALALAGVAIGALGYGWIAGRAPLGQDRAAVEAIVRDYLARHPEAIVAAIEALQRQEADGQRGAQRAQVAAHRARLVGDADAPSMGPAKAAVTVVEFFDYQCGYCKAMLPAMRELMAADADLRFVFKELPILGPESVVAARAALAAWKIDPTRYFDLHAALLSGRGELSEARIFAAVAEAGYAPEQVRAGMADPTVNQAIARNIELAQRLDVRGTPTFIIGDELVPGATNLDNLRRLVVAARESCRAAGTC